MANQTNPITGYRVTLMPETPASPGVGGWIRLFNGESDAGYIHISENVSEPHLGGPDDNPYIVTQVKASFLPTMLDMLRNEPGLQIRFAGDGATPSVFIEPVGGPDTP